MLPATFGVDPWPTVFPSTSLFGAPAHTDTRTTRVFVREVYNDMAIVWNYPPFGVITDPNTSYDLCILVSWPAGVGQAFGTTYPAGSAILLRTGWSQRWPDARAYLGDDTAGDASNLHFPSYSEEAARLLVDSPLQPADATAARQASALAAVDPVDPSVRALTTAMRAGVRAWTGRADAGLFAAVVGRRWAK